MIRTMTALVILVGVGSAMADNPPPNLVKVEGVAAAGKTIKVGSFVCKPVQMTEAYTVDVGGRTEQRTRTVTKIVCEKMLTDMSLANAMAFDVNGKPISQDNMWQRLKPNEVIVTATGQLPDAAFLNILRKDAIVIVLPNAGATPPGGIAPMPVPVPTPGASPVPTPVTPMAPKPIPAPRTIPPMAATRNPAAAQQHILEGRNSLARHNSADAVHHFQAAAQADPGDPSALYFLAYAQFENGDNAAAEDTVQQAVQAERSPFSAPLGFEWERFQGPSRFRLAAARIRAHENKPQPAPVVPNIRPPA